MSAIDDQWKAAAAAHEGALAEFEAASAAVLAHIKAGEPLPKAELDREWTARICLIQARAQEERLARLRTQTIYA